MARKEYRGGAAETTLATSITNVSTSITVTDATNWPTGATGNFWIKIGVGLANEEKIRCTSRAGNILTVATGGRGGDGTTAIAHDPPEIVTHEGVAEDFDEANAHINDTATDHHAQYLNVPRHDTTARHTVGTVIPASATVSDIGTASAGVANSLSRGDHVHGPGAHTHATPAHTHDFAAWAAYTPALTGITISNGTLACRALRSGSVGFLSIKITFGSSTSVTGIVGVPLPAGWTVQGEIFLPLFVRSGGIVLSGITVASGTALSALWSPDTTPSMNLLSPATPNAWTTGDVIATSGVLELQ